MPGNILTGGDGTVPSALPFVPQPPGTSAPFDAAGVIDLASPGFTGNVAPSNAFGLGDDRSNTFAALSFPFLRGDPLRLPGKSAGNLFSFIQSLLLNEAGLQGGRLGQAESALRTAGSNVFGSKAGGLSESMLSRLMTDPTPQADAIRGAEAATRQRTMGARDAILAGLEGGQASRGAVGGESDLARAGADFGVRSALDTRLSDLNIRAAEVQRQEELGNLAGANLGLRTILSQQFEPTDRLLQFLTQYQNNPLNSFLEFSGQGIPLAMADELREAASSFTLRDFLTEVAVPLTAAGLGAAGQAGGFGKLF